MHNDKLNSVTPSDQIQRPIVTQSMVGREPGSFADVNEELLSELHEPRPSIELNQKVEESQPFNKAISVLLTQLGIKEKALTVYYPGSGTHVIPENLFKEDSTIVYVDPYKVAMDCLRLENKEAHISTAQEFDLIKNGYSKADLAIYLNPNGFSHPDITEQIKPGGYLLTSNGWNKTAGAIATDSSSGFELVFIVLTQDDQVPIVMDAKKLKINWSPQWMGIDAEVENSTTDLNTDNCFFIFKKSE